MATTVAELNVKVGVDLASFMSGMDKVKRTLIDLDSNTKTTVNKINAGFKITPTVDSFKYNQGFRDLVSSAKNTGNLVNQALKISPTVNTKNLRRQQTAINQYARNGTMFTTPNIVKGYLSFEGAREIASYADEWTKAGNKINAASEISGRAARPLEKINDIATETRSGLEETVDLYAKLMRSTKDVVTSEEDVARATSIVNKAFKTGGAALSEQKAGIMQLGQALGSGMLQGDELRSVRENAPVLAQAIADYFGTTIAGLKQLGSEGQLTSDKIFKAILAAEGKINTAYATTNQTIAESFTLVSNAMAQYIGQTNEATSIGSRLVEGLKALAANFDTVANVVLKLASIVAAAFIGRAIGGMITSLGLLTGQFIQLASAIRLFMGGASIAALGTALGGLVPVLGTIGAIIGTIVIGSLTAFGNSSKETVEAASAFEAGLKKIEDQAKATSKEVDAVTEAQKRQKEEQEKKNLDYSLNQENDQRKKIVNTINDEIEALKDAEENDRAFRMFTGAQTQLNYTYENIQQLQTLVKELDSGKMSANSFLEKLKEMKNINPLFDSIISKLEEMGIKFGNIGKLIEDQKQTIMGEQGSAYNEHMLNLQNAYQNKYAKQDFFQGQLDLADNSKFEKLVDKEVKRLTEEMAKLGTKFNYTPEELRAAAEKNVTAGLQAKSTDAAIEKYVNNVIGAESGGKANAKNPLSSATGVGQFIESTWLSLFTEMFPEEAKTKTKQQILDLRNDIETSKVLIAQYAKENAQALQNAGITVDEAALQLAHFLGPQGAIKVLTAAPGTPIKGLLSDNAIAANQSILGNGATVEDVKGYAQKRAGMNTPLAQQFGAKEEFGFTLEGWQQAVKNREAMVTVQAKLNPLQTDYGRAVAEEQAAEEALNYAREHGLEVSKEVHDINDLLHGDLSQLTPAAREQAQAMRDYAISMGDVEVKANTLSASQDRLKKDFEDLRTTSRDVLQGFVQDLIDGKSAAEALSNALKKIADKLMDKAFDLLFNSKEQGGSGIFDTIIHALGFASGGSISGPGSGTSDSIPIMASNGEYIVNAKSAAKARPLLDAINYGGHVPAFANGGYVSVPNAKMGPGSISRGGSQSALVIKLDTDDSAIAGIADARIKHASPSIIKYSVVESQRQTKNNMSSYIANAQSRTM